MLEASALDDAKEDVAAYMEELRDKKIDFKDRALNDLLEELRVLKQHLT